MKNSNRNATVLLIIAMLILGLMIFGCGNQDFDSQETQPVVRESSEYNKPHSEMRKFDLHAKRTKVNQSINEGINTIDRALEDLK